MKCVPSSLKPATSRRAAVATSRTGCPRPACTSWTAAAQADLALKQCHRLRIDQNEPTRRFCSSRRTPSRGHVWRAWNAAPIPRWPGPSSRRNCWRRCRRSCGSRIATIYWPARRRRRNRVYQRLQAATQQMDQELELRAAGCRRASCRRVCRSCRASGSPSSTSRASRVGGDFYDIFRLDEKHLGFYIADAMGHGVPASLLTIFVKKGVRAKEISGQSYRLVPPSEVLERLNRDLIEQQIPDLPFITMIYVLFNCQDGTLQFSRAGHPYPLYVPKDGQADPLANRGEPARRLRDAVSPANASPQARRQVAALHRRHGRRVVRAAPGRPGQPARGRGDIPRLCRSRNWSNAWRRTSSPKPGKPTI